MPADDITTPNPFVAIFSPSGGAPLDAWVLQGFLGNGPGTGDDATKRIYFSMDLKHYAQFLVEEGTPGTPGTPKKANVLYRTTTSQEDHPLGLQIDTVWLRPEAKITYVPNLPPPGWSQPGASGGMPAPYGGGLWAGAYRPYGGNPWAGAYGPYGGGLWAGAIGAYGGGQWSG
jgi:hypothetical protein